MTASLVGALSESSILTLFVVIGFGFLLGEVSVFGFRFGVAGVLFAGLAVGSLSPLITVPGGHPDFRPDPVRVRDGRELRASVLRRLPAARLSRQCVRGWGVDPGSAAHVRTRPPAWPAGNSDGRAVPVAHSTTGPHWRPCRSGCANGQGSRGSSHRTSRVSPTSPSWRTASPIRSARSGPLIRFQLAGRVWPVAPRPATRRTRAGGSRLRGQESQP